MTKFTDGTNKSQVMLIPVILGVIDNLDQCSLDESVGQAVGLRMICRGDSMFSVQYQ